MEPIKNIGIMGENITTACLWQAHNSLALQLLYLIGKTITIVEANPLLPSHLHPCR